MRGVEKCVLELHRRGVVVTVLVACIQLSPSEGLTQGSSGRIPERCTTRPEVFSREFLHKLDEAPSSEINALYDSHISANARKNVTPSDFADAVGKLQQPSYGQATPSSSYEFLGTQRSRDGYVVNFSGFSKGYGRIIRQVEVTCEGREWKINDLTVRPSRE